MIMTWNLDQQLKLQEKKQKNKKTNKKKKHGKAKKIWRWRYVGQFGPIRIPDACSVKLTFSLTVTFYLTKIKNN